MQAASALPQLALAQSKQNQTDASLLQTVGAAEQGQTQQDLNTQYGQWQEQQNWPVQNLDLLLGALGGVPYGTTTSGTAQGVSQSKSPLTGALGGAASGAAIGSMFGPGYGTAVGAAAGGILGALS